MWLIYRISDAGYKKEKPDYINNRNCLRNARKVFKHSDINWLIIADNISMDTEQMINEIAPNTLIEEVNIGHGAGTFNIGLDFALTKGDNEIIYFLENDYLHREGAYEAIQEGLERADYLSLYDHPDKYIDGKSGGNPQVIGGGENTKVFLTASVHWKITNSTTMTFASKVNTLKKDEKIIRKWTDGVHPFDYKLFSALKKRKRSLISPLPGYSTHGETAFLSPLINWSTLL